VDRTAIQKSPRSQKTTSGEKPGHRARGRQVPQNGASDRNRSVVNLSNAKKEKKNNKNKNLETIRW